MSENPLVNRFCYPLSDANRRMLICAVVVEDCPYTDWSGVKPGESPRLTFRRQTCVLVMDAEHLRTYPVDQVRMLP